MGFVPKTISMFFNKKKSEDPFAFLDKLGTSVQSKLWTPQSVEQKLDQVVMAIKDTVYEYDTGIAFSKRAVVEIPLFRERLYGGENMNMGFAYFSAPRAPKCDYILKGQDDEDHYFVKQADVEVSRAGLPLKAKKVRAKAKTK